MHLGINECTLEIRAIEVTDKRVGDAQMPPELLKQIDAGEPIAGVTADGGYGTKACHVAIAARAAFAVIPPRKNAQAWKGNGVGEQVRNAAVAACQRLGRTIWNQWSADHQRSLVESKMRCLKRLAERLMARTFESQVTELHFFEYIIIYESYQKSNYLPK